MINKPKLAIAFDTIVDEDFGLIKLIFNQYLDPNVFDLDKFKRSGLEILNSLYMREEINPLLSFTLPNISKEKADSLYNEFLDTQYDEIISRSIGTNVHSFLKSIIKSREFEIVVFCYNKKQLEIANEITDFNEISKTLFNKELWESTYQFYFKYLYQSYPLKNVSGYHFYYSTIGPNLNKEKNDIKLDDEEIRLIRKSNYLSLYTLYNINNPFEEEREINDELS